MTIDLKPLADQVIVITGATSGIGLTTARLAAKRGAKLVLVSRNADTLRQLSDEINNRGGEAMYVVADVGDEGEVRRIAQETIEHFGTFDTWVNNAGVSIFTRLEDASLDEYRRLFDTNFWGVVHGSLTALKHLRKQGGSIINIGSEVSDLPAPIQTMYSASKHAVKGFTNGLRMEIDSENLPISVTLIKPASIDTMFVEHAANHLPVEPKLPDPIYAPDAVADAILYAAEHPRREIFVGAAAKLGSAAYRRAPGLMERVIQRVMLPAQKSNQPPSSSSQTALFNASTDLQEREGMGKGVMETSFYTQAVTRKRQLSLAMVGTALGLMALYGFRHRGPARVGSSG